MGYYSFQMGYTSAGRHNILLKTEEAAYEFSAKYVSTHVFVY